MSDSRTIYRRRRRAVTRAPRRDTQEAPRRPGGQTPAQAPLGPNVLRLLVCGVLFVSLVALKLLFPGPMTAVRGTLASYLVRDADFEAAFSSVGRAVSGEGGVLDSLEDAYIAVFGPAEAREVAAPAEIPAGDVAGDSQADGSPADGSPADGSQAGEPDDAADYPPHAAVGQRVLGFDHAAPLDGTLTSPFGWREHPVTGSESFHYGVDIAAEEGAEVRCFADGVVGVTGESTELGKYLTVHHENGVSTLYGHLSSVAVASGEQVTLGQRLGAAGQTGNATGPHLHFELHDGEDYLDPVFYLS